MFAYKEMLTHAHAHTYTHTHTHTRMNSLYDQVVGFGQHQVPTLSMRGECFDLAPQNTEILIPLVHSNSVGWSYLLNAPG